MYSFIICLVVLILGYVIYSKIIERLVKVDPARITPAISLKDGIDYVPMKPWRIFLIQFLNIAGVGPICGAIMGAQFGTASFIWIVFGSIFAGAVHDFVSGFISLRHKGCSLPEIHGRYQGHVAKKIMYVFTFILMVLVGAVFVNTPASLLHDNFTADWSVFIWVGIIFAYYLVATLVPIDKVIGKIYPIFGFLLLGMAGALLVALFLHWDSTSIHLPEIWHGMENQHPDKEHNPIFPMMFISIACGAISGFHATQSPLMARCMVNERQARPIFYGAMIAEGIVALIWAAAAAYFFNEPTLQLKSAGQSGAQMVGVIANEWFTPVLAVVTILGVISAAITSGDTALRSCRLIVAEFFKIDQKPISKRLLVAIPLFAITGGVLVYSLIDNNGFQTIWRYFAWANQVLATVTLWAISVFLVWKGKPYWFAVIPALFMTAVTSCFIFVAEKEGFGSFIPRPWGYALGGFVTLIFAYHFFHWEHTRNPKIIKDGDEDIDYFDKYQLAAYYARNKHSLDIIHRIHDRHLRKMIESLREKENVNTKENVDVDVNMKKNEN